MARPFAVFDIDGTLIRWQLYHALADELAGKGLIDPKAFKQVELARFSWKKRDSSDAYRTYEHKMVEVFDRALLSMRPEDFVAAAETVFSEYKQQLYTYTRQLMADLKAKDYLLFAISGSPDIIVKMLVGFYGFDDFAATVYEIKDGHFTGVKDVSVSNKPELLKRLVRSNETDWSGSLGIGDSESDIAMLDLVEQPIAFNPTNELYAHAKANAWPIVLERKSVIYELEANHHGYKLV